MLNNDIKNKMNYVIDNCMGESMAYCSSSCPMKADPKEYIRLIGEGKEEEALEVIRKNLFLPKTLGRICAHPCEQNCKHNEQNSPMSIAGLKRYVADNYDDSSKWNLTTKKKQNKKVAIIGSGPSGAQAALDLIKEGFEVSIYEKLNHVGGMLRVGIPEYRLPRDVIDSEYSYLEKLGVKFNLGIEIGKDISFDEILNAYDSVVVAVGKSLGRIDKSLKHHENKDIYSAAGFLKEVSLKNLDEINGDVLVIGGGDVAMDCARTSLRLKNSKNINLISLENSLDKLPASEHEIKLALEEGVNIVNGYGIKEIILDDNKNIKEVILKKCLSMFDENNNFNLVFDESDTKTIKANAIIFAIGQVVDNSFDKSNVLETNRNSTFSCDNLTMQSTSNEKVFIAGDASNNSVIVVQAMAVGRRAAKSVIRFLADKDLKEGRKLEDEFSFETNLKTEVDWDNIKKVKRISINELEVEKRINNFDEVSLGFTKEEARTEASRCLSCECRLCMKDCLMLSEFTTSPKALFEKFINDDFDNIDPLIPYSCNQCNQCTIKCPNDLEPRVIFDEFRKTYATNNNGHSPLEGHKDLDEAIRIDCSKDKSTFIETKGNNQKRYVLIPGCTVPNYNPNHVIDSLNHLNEVFDNEVGAVLQCCAKPTLMLGEEDKFKERFKLVQDAIDKTNATTIVTLCPSCFLTYEKYATQEVISYWDLIREIGVPKTQKNIGKDSDVIFNIHDSCPTRHVSSHHENVRYILDELGYKYEEMDNIKENTRCCGVGGMSGCVNPSLQTKVLDRRINDANKESIISYCGSCRASMETGGLDSLHILDLIHGKTYTKDDMDKERGVNIDASKNRMLTKELLDKYKK